MLDVSGLHLWRGERHVLKGLSLHLGAGQALQLLWPNGAGKTSLLRAVAGLLPSESGQISWCGQPVTDDPLAYCRNLAFLGHELALKGDLTVLENLHYSLGLRGGVTAVQLQAALQHTGLQTLADELVRHLSAGQKRRVALARLGLWQAPLWLLDEPVANLDAAGQQLVAAAIDTHLQAGGCALIATHQPLALSSAGNRLWQQPQEAA